MPNSDFITVVTPDGEIWTDQEYFIRKDVVTGLRLVKKLSPQGADNAVEIHTS